MISFSNPLVLLLFVPLLALTAFAWRNAYSNLSPRRMRVSLALRLVILAALVLALAGATVRVPQSRQAAVVVADLSASDFGQRSAVQSTVNAAAGNRPGSNTLGVVDVGRQPVVEQPVTGLSAFSGFQSQVDRQYTNLAGGLDLANAILPGGYQRRVVLATDGQQNVGDAVAAARLLRSQGVRVDALSVGTRSGPEVLVDSVNVPPQLRARESFSVTVAVRSTTTTTTRISLFRDRTLVGSRQETVRLGVNTYVFAQQPLPPGFHTYSVEITPTRDTQPENNAGSAFTTVAGPPRVLVIAQQPSEAGSVMASLKSTGISADLQRPVQVTPELTYLDRYASVVIVDTAADELGAGIMAQLVPYVHDQGHGLVVLGGQNAYSMGGYGQTPLEQVLPVNMNIPKKRALPSAAVVLIIESLEEDTQINISKEAGKGVVDLLTPQDQVAVSDAPFDGSAGWVVTMQHVTDKGRIGGAIDRMVPGDPESYTPFLQAADDTLKRTNARIKHIILLGDGDAEDPEYQSLVEKIHADGITVSTVSTNGLGRNDFQTMQSIAQWGGGRYYEANDPSKIPEIFLREARTVARSGIVQGKFFPQELSANPMVRDLKSVAALYGYVATTPKPAAEIVLASKKLDPVLAAWQYGLGRSVAWTSDAAGLWTKDWLRLPSANRFWANVVSWTLPAANTGQLSVTASSSQGEGRISVTTPASLGAVPNVTARILDPTLHTSTIQLQPSAPGQFGGAFQEGVQGAYFVTVEAHGAGHGAAGQVGMDVPYSPEYLTVGVDRSFLRQVAVAGGGSVITRPQDIWSNNLPSVLAAYDLRTWLVLLGLLLLPIDIGVRRLVVSWEELLTLLAAIPRWRREAAPSMEPSIATLDAIRARRAQRQASETSIPMSWDVPSPDDGRGMAQAASVVAMPADGDRGDEESTAGKLLRSRRGRR